MAEQNERDRLMERTAAARVYVNSHAHNAKQQRELELRAFMAIFHPDMTEDQIREMIREE